MDRRPASFPGKGAAIQAAVHRIVFDEYDTPLGKLFLAEAQDAAGAHLGAASIRFLDDVPERPSDPSPKGAAGRERPSAETAMVRHLEDLVRLYPETEMRPGRCAGLRGRLDRYFKRCEWEPLTPPSFLSGTSFERDVWLQIARIPKGRTVSYGEIAARLGRPGASRAVGGATGRNPLPVLVPCHRVVGSDGRMTGFGGGLWRKEWLLKHEGAMLL